MRKGFEIITVIQCDPGCDQGRMNDRGSISREIHSIQLLGSWTGIVSGTPSVRIGKFVNINGTLREVIWQESEPSVGRRGFWRVTLHGDEKLPSVFTPTTELEL